MVTNKELIVKDVQRKRLSEIKFFADDPSLVEKRQIRVIAASGKADRVGDVVKIDGIDMGSFLANPVVLWAHDHHGLPVAKAVAAAVIKGRLHMTFEFATADVYGFADTVYKLIRGKFLNGVSIGARVKEAEFIKDEDGNIIGRKFTSLELLEVSIVPIPADSRALVTAVKSGQLTDSEFEECITKTLEAPLDLLGYNPVQVSTEDDASELVSAEEEELMKEQITQLETRITHLETLLKAQSESNAANSKSLDAVTTLFGSLSAQMATKQAPDTKALLETLPEGSPATDMMKQVFGMLDSMQSKLSGAR